MLVRKGSLPLVQVGREGDELAELAVILLHESYSCTAPMVSVTRSNSCASDCQLGERGARAARQSYIDSDLLGIVNDFVKAVVVVVLRIVSNASRDSAIRDASVCVRETPIQRRLMQE